MGSVFLSPHYKNEPVTRSDIEIASLAFGFTLGFGFLTCAKAGRQTLKIWRRQRRVTVYVSLIWLEILVSLIFCFICWFYLSGSFPPSFAFFFSILTMWALQVQFLLQIIINRIGILIPDKRKVMWIKWGVAALITAVNISVYNIWVPARLQVSEEYIYINEWWDRCEKGIYLIVDGILNAYFLWLVKTRLLSTGMSKYKPLYKFNAMIVGFSLSMDVLIISMMSLKNTFVYMQFHPVAYIVKLNIEMTMADLITKVAKLPNKSSGPGQYGHQSSMQTARSWTTSATAVRHSAGAYNQIDNGHVNVLTKTTPDDLNLCDVKRYRAWVDTKPSPTVRVTSSQEEHNIESSPSYSDEESGIGPDPDDVNDMIYSGNVIMQTRETRVATESMHESIDSDRSTNKLKGDTARPF